jgi:hypothetical protein
MSRIGTLEEDLVELVRKVESMIVLKQREIDRKAQMSQKIENLMVELTLEKEKNFKLKMELETIREGTVEKGLAELKGQVESMNVLLRREADGKAQMVQKIENLMEEMILEKEKNFKLKMELETIREGTVEQGLAELKGLVESMNDLLRREADGKAQMVQKIENLMEEIILEKEKNFKLKMILETINFVSSGATTASID